MIHYPICGVRPRPFCRVGLFATTADGHSSQIATVEVDSRRKKKAHKSALAPMKKKAHKNQISIVNAMCDLNFQVDMCIFIGTGSNKTRVLHELTLMISKQICLAYHF